MNKYQNLLLANINLQLEEWLESGDVQVSHEDIGRFLHTVAGTAGTVGLPELSHTLKIAIVDDDAVVRTLLTEYVKSCFPADITTEYWEIEDAYGKYYEL